MNAPLFLIGLLVALLVARYQARRLHRSLPRSMAAIATVYLLGVPLLYVVVAVSFFATRGATLGDWIFSFPRTFDFLYRTFAPGGSHYAIAIGCCASAAGCAALSLGRTRPRRLGWSAAACGLVLLFGLCFPSLPSREQMVRFPETLLPLFWQCVVWGGGAGGFAACGVFCHDSVLYSRSQSSPIRHYRLLRNTGLVILATLFLHQVFWVRRAVPVTLVAPALHELRLHLRQHAGPVTLPLVGALELSASSDFGIGIAPAADTATPYKILRTVIDRDSYRGAPARIADKTIYLHDWATLIDGGRCKLTFPGGSETHSAEIDFPEVGELTFIMAKATNPLSTQSVVKVGVSAEGGGSLTVKSPVRDAIMLNYTAITPPANAEVPSLWQMVCAAFRLCIAGEQRGRTIVPEHNDGIATMAVDLVDPTQSVAFYGLTSCRATVDRGQFPDLLRDVQSCVGLDVEVAGGTLSLGGAQDIKLPAHARLSLSESGEYTSIMLEHEEGGIVAKGHCLDVTLNGEQLVPTFWESLSTLTKVQILAVLGSILVFARKRLLAWWKPEIPGARPIVIVIWDWFQGRDLPTVS